MEKVVMIGNCQMSGIRTILDFTTFKDKYTVEQFANWQMIANRDAPPVQSLASADIVIYQPLSDVHGCYITNRENPDSMLNVCKEDTVFIEMPRIHNNSLWPIYAKHNSKTAYYGGEYLDSCRGASRHQIIQLYDEGKLDFKFIDRYNRNMDISLERERSCDIKVANFIRSNLKTQELFLMHEHPTSCVYAHCVDQMLDRLRIEYTADVTGVDENLANCEDSVYHIPSGRFPQSSFSVKELGLPLAKYIDDNFYRDRLIDHLNLLAIA